MSIFATSPRLPKPVKVEDGMSYASFSSFAPKPYAVKSPRSEQELTLPQVRPQLKQNPLIRRQGGAASSIVMGDSGSLSARLASTAVQSGSSVGRSPRSARSARTENMGSTQQQQQQDPDTVSLKESPAALLYCSKKHRQKLAADHDTRQAAISTSSGSRSSSRRFKCMLAAQVASDRSSYLGTGQSTGGYSLSIDNGFFGLKAPRPPTTTGKVDLDRHGGPPSSTKGTFSQSGRPSMVRRSGDPWGPNYNPDQQAQDKRDRERADPHCVSAAFAADTRADRPRFEPNAGKDDANRHAAHAYELPNSWICNSHHKNVVGDKRKKAKFAMK